MNSQETNEPLNETEEKTPKAAIASLALGIFSMLGGVLLLLIPPILAIVFGFTSLSKKINKGQGLAIAGIVMGGLSIVAIPVMGLMGAMAIPAFQEVRDSAQENTILNNLRILAAAADTYMLETGEDSAPVSELIGEGKYFPQLSDIPGTIYPEVIHASDTYIEAIRANGETIRYEL